MPAMPPREIYVRAVVRRDGYELIGGIEWRPEVDDAKALRTALRHVLLGVQLPQPELGIYRALERGIDRLWPGRLWFVEFGDIHGDDEGWVQAYQPARAGAR